MNIPTTTQFKARPVWARYLRRRELERAATAMAASFGEDVALPIGPPSDEEKADAIEILAAVPQFLEEMKETIFPEAAAVTAALIQEAERIWLEGSEEGGYGRSVGDK
jgi:DNA-binding MurR/RpiR family transcriptional regulator